VVHATPDNLWRAPMPDAPDDQLRETYGRLDVPLIAYGHIHRGFIREMDRLTVANTGSVGLPYDSDPRASYLLVDDGVPSLRRVVVHNDWARAHQTHRVCCEDRWPQHLHVGEP